MKTLIILSLSLLACGGQPVLQKTVQQADKTPKAAEKQKQQSKSFSIIPYDINDIKIEAKALPTEAKSNNVNVVTTKGYRLQVAVLSDFTRTKEVEARLKSELANSEHAVHVDFYSPNYRIRVGDFKTRDDAKKVIPMIKKLGYKDCFIVFDQVTLILGEDPK